MLNFQLGTALEEKPDTTTIVNEFIESSGVNAIGEMIDMIELMRIFEANQKIIKSIDEIMGKAITLGKV